MEALITSLDPLFSPLSNTTKINPPVNSQRLDYAVCETIFYQLILMIDPAECRRKFWGIYPSRDADERTRFIENTAQFINGKQLVPYKVTASQLRMCGGEPFRRLLTSLINKAADVEIKANIKRLKLKEEEMQISTSWEEILDKQDHTRDIIRERILEFKFVKSRLEELKEKLSDMESELKDTSNSLSEEVYGEISSLNHYDERRLKDMYKILLVRLEKSHSRCKIAAEQIKKTPPLEVISTPIIGFPTRKVRRMSDYFKEMRERLTSSPLINKISERIYHYDSRIEAIISNWENDLEKADDEFLRRPEIMEQFEFWSKLIPPLDIKPVNFDLDAQKVSKVD